MRNQRFVVLHDSPTEVYRLMNAQFLGFKFDLKKCLRWTVFITKFVTKRTQINEMTSDKPGEIVEKDFKRLEVEIEGSSLLVTLRETIRFIVKIV